MGDQQDRPANAMNELKDSTPWVRMRAFQPSPHHWRIAMPSNSEQIVQQVHQDFHALVAYVTGADARTQTAYTVELTLFRRLLALGAALLQLFFVTRASTRPTEPVQAPDGTLLTYHDRRPISYYSIFGKLRFWRHYFIASGQGGTCPLDADLSLPERCYSDLLRDWACAGYRPHPPLSVRAHRSRRSS